MKPCNPETLRLAGLLSSPPESGLLASFSKVDARNSRFRRLKPLAHTAHFTTKHVRRSSRWGGNRYFVSPTFTSAMVSLPDAQFNRLCETLTVISKVAGPNN
jgi:hypothetical protein